MMNWDKIIMLLTFTVIMLGLSLLVSSLITLRWTATTELHLSTKILIAVVLALFFMAPPLLRCPPDGITGTLCTVLTYIAYFIFVCIFLFFCFMLVRDVVWGVGRMLGINWPPLFQPSAVLKANIYLLAVVVFLSGWALYEGTKVPNVKKVMIYTNKVNEPFTIALLPDIHVHRALSAKKLKGIIDKTNELNPDAIALAGDIIDDTPDTIKDLTPILSEFKAKYGVFAVDGNHEVYIGSKQPKEIFQKNNITHLNNQSVTLRPDIVIAGVPDMRSYKNPPNFKEALPETEAYTVLLAHTPKMFDMEGNISDLQLSGHTHGGQIFPFHILARHSNKYLAGLIQKNGRSLYVSRGAGQWGPQMRLFAPSEITLISIYPRLSQFTSENQRPEK